MDAIAAVFPWFFFLVAALVCLTTMTRMVEEERTQIGVLKALGYGGLRIAFIICFTRPLPAFWAAPPAARWRNSAAQGDMERL